MKRMFGLMVAALAVAVLSGCSNIRATNNFNGQGLTASTSTPMAHINAKISGVYILWFMPLWSGSEESVGSPSFFSNNVTVKNTVGILTAKSKEVGATRVVDLQTCWQVKDLWIMPPFLICIKECQASGNAIK